MIACIRTLLSALALLCLAALPAAAAFETRAEAAYVYDVTTDTVLLAKQADVPMPPASMSKLMTLNMLFEALRDGRVTLDTRFGVSTRARQMGGSTMFLNEQDRPTVEELIRGIVVLSGNDACVVVAEGLAGTEDAFARVMNERAEELGMTGSTFANSHGWPNPNHRMSMEDLGKIAARLITEFPEYYGYFGEKEFAWDGRAPDNRFNRNPLLDLGIGADGLKTGHTQEAGYGIVGSAQQGTRRIVFVLTGLTSEAERAQESERLVNWAFRQFVEEQVAAEGDVISVADVWMGDHLEIGLKAPRDLITLMPARTGSDMQAAVVYRGPIEAPVEEGQQVAELVIQREDLPEARLPLVSDRAVERGGFLPRIRSAAWVMMGKVIGEAQSLF